MNYFRRASQGLLALLTGIGSVSYARPDMTPSAPMVREFIWTNAAGMVSATQCKLKLSNEAPFAVTLAADGGNYENLRIARGQRKSDLVVESKVTNYSLVKLVPGRQFENYESIEITGVHENPEVKLSGKIAQRNYHGYIYDRSLQPLKDYVFRLKDNPSLSDGSKFTHIPRTGYAMLNAYLQPVILNHKYLMYECPNANDANKVDEYAVFDLHPIGMSEVVARVGVGKDTSIFRHLHTYNLAQAEEAMRETSVSALADATKSTLGFINKFAQDLFRQTDEQAAGEVAPEELEQDAEGDDGIDYTQSDADESLVDQGKDTEEEVPVIFGSHEFRVCIDSGPLNVRGLDANGEIDTNNSIFEVSRYEVANPVQSFDGPSEKRANRNGRDIDFIMVKFPNVDGENIGWVAKELVVPASHCASYQRSLGKSQPLICINSGDLNVYDVRNGKFTMKDFRGRQFEEIAIRSDMGNQTRSQVVDGKTVEYVPVVFLNRNNETGWVAQKFIKTKGACDAYKSAGSNGGGSSTSTPSVSGALFPSPGRPTASYVKGGPGVGKKYFGAVRSDTRLHAACDLFRPFRDKVQAVMNGQVIQDIYYFYLGTYALEVKHSDGKVVRYGEVTGRLLSGRTVKKGDVMTTVARNTSPKRSSMLHFEMYKGTKTGTLSGGGAYQRRSDLMNPTSSLQSWEKARFGKSW